MSRPIMDAGRRNLLVRVQYRSDGVSTSGFPVDDWDETPEKQIWMNRLTTKGTERLMAMQVQATYDAKWTMAYRTDMDPDLVDLTAERRIVWQGRVHDIVSASLSEDRMDIEILTRMNPAAERVA